MHCDGEVTTKWERVPLSLEKCEKQNAFLSSVVLDFLREASKWFRQSTVERNREVYILRNTRD